MFRRRTLPSDPGHETFDLTPMIDCTFQLILFFMLVTDMADAQIEKVRLPAASQASVLPTDPPLVVNLPPDGRPVVAGRVLSDAALEALFEGRRATKARFPVLIRADRSTPFAQVQKVMTIASELGGVSRVEFGARKE